MDSSGEATALPEAPPAANGTRDFVAAERAQRLAKQERLLARTGPAYRFDRDHTLAQLHRDFDGLEPGGEDATTMRVAGRIALLRPHGGAVFLRFLDPTPPTHALFCPRTP